MCGCFDGCGGCLRTLRMGRCEGRICDERARRAVG